MIARHPERRTVLLVYRAEHRDLLGTTGVCIRTARRCPVPARARTLLTADAGIRAPERSRVRSLRAASQPVPEENLEATRAAGTLATKAIPSAPAGITVPNEQRPPSLCCRRGAAAGSVVLSAEKPRGTERHWRRSSPVKECGQRRPGDRVAVVLPLHPRRRPTLAQRTGEAGVHR